ncbi:MAG: hypothetical protein H0W95_01585 [Nocardioidaceae bacterium]|nr:hypothetical protein [Nocardioidaceae bacterium]
MVARVVAVGIGLVLLAGPVQARTDTSPTLEVDPALPGSAAQVTGSGWDPDPELGCTLTTEIPGAVIGDGGCTVSAEGVIGETVLIPAETEPGDYVLRVCQPACDQVNGVGAELKDVLVVLEPAPIPDDTTAPPPIDNGGSSDGSTGDGEAEDVTPTSGDLPNLVWWAVLAVLLLAALAIAVRFRRRRVVAPATAVAALRPTAPPVVRVDGADRPPRWTIGLAPRPDPGTTTVEEVDR